MFFFLISLCTDLPDIPSGSWGPFIVFHSRWWLFCFIMVFIKRMFIWCHLVKLITESNNGRRSLSMSCCWYAWSWYAYKRLSCMQMHFLRWHAMQRWGRLFYWNLGERYHPNYIRHVSYWSSTDYFNWSQVGCSLSLEFFSVWSFTSVLITLVWVVLSLCMWPKKEPYLPSLGLSLSMSLKVRLLSLYIFIDSLQWFR